MQHAKIFSRKVGHCIQKPRGGDEMFLFVYKEVGTLHYLRHVRCLQALAKEDWAAFPT